MTEQTIPVTRVSAAVKTDGADIRTGFVPVGGADLFVHRGHFPDGRSVNAPGPFVGIGVSGTDEESLRPDIGLCLTPDEARAWADALEQIADHVETEVADAE